MKEISKEILWYGQSDSQTEKVELKAGPMTLAYKGGAIRSICLGDHEVLRMIYFALRDHNWGTIIPTIKKEEIVKHEKGFEISFESHFDKRGIHFIFHSNISGNSTGELVFEIRGEANSGFLTNRTGFCVLHPIKECRGINCEITDPTGTKQIFKFPELISPHQPMKKIKEMTWELGQLGRASLAFEGDVFEMEDQRNWTDDSYKTYCRPLELPYPYPLKKGDKIHQKICLSVKTDSQINSSSTNSYKLHFDQNIQYALPEIGVGRSSLKSTLSDCEIELIKKVNFDFYEIEVVFDKRWKRKLKAGIDESKAMQLPLKLKLHFSSQNAEEIKAISEVLGKQIDQVKSILILNIEDLVPSDRFISEVMPQLKAVFPHARIGSGTTGFFAELNRNRIKNEKLDFLSYAITPQVHSFDHLTLVENLNGQSATVETARSFANSKEIHISSVTLKMQSNPAATSENDEPTAELSSQIDVRQMSLLGAGWTLGSIKKLTETGAASVTFFETVGEKGIIQGELAPKNQKVFQVEKGAVFPVYYVLKEILNEHRVNVIHSQSSHPTIFDGIVFEENGKFTFLIANFTDKQINVRIDGISDKVIVKKLDEKSATKAMYDPDKYEKSPFCDFNFDQPVSTIKLRPFGIAFIRNL